MFNDLLREEIPRAARTVSRRFTDVSRDDIGQEIWAWALAEGSRLETEGLSASPDSDDYRAAVKRLRLDLRRAGERYARKERAAIRGYSPDDEAFYSERALVEVLLPALFAAGLAESPPRTSERSGRHARTDGAEYGTWLVSLLDVQSGLERIKEEHRWILWKRFGESVDRTDAELAEELGITVDQLRSRVRWAVGRLQYQLGGPSPYRGRPTT